MNFIPYEVSFGEANYPEGFFDTIKNLPIDEQVRFFALCGTTRFQHTGWQERNVQNYRPLCEDGPDVIVKDGVIWGVMIKDHMGRSCPVPPERGVCTYYASDNNGAGYKERRDFKYLVCVNCD